MRPFSAMLLLLAAAVAAVPAAADQNDPRLSELFDELQAAPDPRAARDIEQQIWLIWTRHEDDAVNSLMSVGVAQMSRRDYSGALGSFEEIIAADPEFAEGWNKRATVHWLMENYDESLVDIERTLKLEPRHFGALSGRGLVYIELEEWERALEAFEAALAVNPQMRGPQVNAEALRLLLDRREI